jgi:hypothetical protein
VTAVVSLKNGQHHADELKAPDIAVRKELDAAARAIIMSAPAMFQKWETSLSHDLEASWSDLIFKVLASEDPLDDGTTREAYLRARVGHMVQLIRKQDSELAKLKVTVAITREYYRRRTECNLTVKVSIM